jgi:hypothetical protein
MNALFLLALVAIAVPATARQKHDDKPAAAAAPLLTSIDGLPFGEIPRQQLPATGCAAYLWSAGTTHALVAMASADPARLRISLDGAVTDLPRTAQVGLGGFGFYQTTTYQAGPITAILDMTVQQRAGLSDGALVSGGTLTLERTGKDTVVLPVGGLIGCAEHPT